MLNRRCCPGEFVKNGSEILLAKTKMRFIFHPSYNRLSNSRFPALLNYEHAMEHDPAKPRYIQVCFSMNRTLSLLLLQCVVVRSQEFHLYQEEWGRTHIIVQLPESINYGFKVTPTAGIGFARLAVQVIAFDLGINKVGTVCWLRSMSASFGRQ